LSGVKRKSGREQKRTEEAEREIKKRQVENRGESGRNKKVALEETQ